MHFECNFDRVLKVRLTRWGTWTGPCKNRWPSTTRSAGPQGCGSRRTRPWCRALPWRVASLPPSRCTIVWHDLKAKVRELTATHAKELEGLPTGRGRGGTLRLRQDAKRPQKGPGSQSPGGGRCQGQPEGHPKAGEPFPFSSPVAVIIVAFVAIHEFAPLQLLQQPGLWIRVLPWIMAS